MIIFKQHLEQPLVFSVAKVAHFTLVENTTIQIRKLYYFTLTLHHTKEYSPTN